MNAKQARLVAQIAVTEENLAYAQSRTGYEYAAENYARDLRRLQGELYEFTH